MSSFAQIIFAGFNLPRVENGPTIYNPTVKPNMAREYLAQRLAKWKAAGKSRGCIGKVTYPNRIRSKETARDFTGWGFYLSSDGTADDRSFSLRWAWCDELPSDWHDEYSPRIDHTGWFCDEFQDAKIRGLVVKLPSGRGFLAGWSMGEGMASELDCHVYDCAVSAAYAADGMADDVAEKERDYRAQETDDDL